MASTIGRAKRASSSRQPQTVERASGSPSRALEPMQGLVVLPAPHDRVGEHARAGPAAQDGQLGRVADQHVDRPLARRVLGDELVEAASEVDRLGADEVRTCGGIIAGPPAP
jgi:hypothetical protein